MTDLPARDLIYRFGRSYEFTAAHRLHSDHFTPQENQQIYGKCNNPAGHGHNYRCTVMIEGHPDETTGMVMNMALLDEIAATILEDFDYKHLDKEVPAFAKRQSTAENITQVLWRCFADALIPYKGVKLYQLNISETRNNQAKLTRTDVSQYPSKEIQ